MNTNIINHTLWGKTLFADNGIIEIGIPLEFGIRIGHLSYKNEDNLFYEQPNDLNDLCTPEGFRIRGGHRLWIAPESKKVYYPDNNPVKYEISENKITLFQEEDPYLRIKKSIEITFTNDEEICINHKILNTKEENRKISIWGITSLAPGGKAVIPLKYRENGYDPLHKISMWDYTNLGDERAKYERENITLSHKPIAQKYKIGVGHPNGSVPYENKGVIFKKVYKINPELEYPDGGVSFEIFMCKHMVEIESLSPFFEVEAGGTAEFNEKWKLKKQD